MFKLNRNKTNFVAKGMTALATSGLSTIMAPMHVNAANTAWDLTTGLCLYGGAASLATITVVIYAICTRKNYTDEPPKTTINAFGEDETTSAKKYFKIINR